MSTSILGIESSCDETAAAVVRAGEHVQSNIVFSQIATHQPYGGVVPELASREHLRAIVPVVRLALEEAGLDFDSIAALAVTQGPGLAGALLVGISYAKALAFALDKPLIAVNHLEGHIHAVLLKEKQRGNHQLRFPVLALVVSGGHTHLYLCQPRNALASAESKEGPRATDGVGWTYQLIGRTRDDAAGEAYDKVAKLLGLGYPGGPIIEKLSHRGNPEAVRFPPAQIKGAERGARGERRQHDFSYSGIKTAVRRYVETHNLRPEIEARRQELTGKSGSSVGDVLGVTSKEVLDLVASFQHAMVEDLVTKTLAAARETDAATLFVTGGVAANTGLRESFERRATREGLPVFFPSRPLSTDNAAMIAAAAYPKFLAGDFADPHFSAEAGLALR